jgi:predicted secreted protein
MKQTALEWLIRILELESFENINLYSMKAIEQAKEMEKEQIIDSFNAGYINSLKRKYTTTEQYYNETFKSE